MLSPKRTFLAQTFSIAACVKYLAAVTVAMKSFLDYFYWAPRRTVGDRSNQSCRR